jgi:hypothetical protein
MPLVYILKNFLNQYNFATNNESFCNSSYNIICYDKSYMRHRVPSFFLTLVQFESELKMPSGAI